MKIKPLLVCALLTIAGKSFSQEYSVPVNYQLNSKDDYVKYEPNIVEAANWLVNTPLNEQKDKRKEVSAFVVQWTSGSPTVNIEITPVIMDFEKKNEGMLVIWMASSSKYVIENNHTTDVRAKQKAALHDMIKVYQSGKGIKKDKKMEALIKSDTEGNLDKWLEENLKMESR
jgi:hypothetical protein